MSPYRHPPWLLELLISWLASQHIKEDLLGDLLEEFHGFCECDYKKAKRVYSTSVLRLIPFLIINRFGEMKSRMTMLSVTAAVLLLCFAIIWESLLVQSQTWPLTVHLKDKSILSAKELYFAIYNILYVLGISLVFVFNGSRKGHPKIFYVPPYILAATLTVMPIISVLFPQPLDSYLMRGFQMLLLWVLAALSVNKRSA